MKKEYLQNFPKPSDFRNQAYNLYLKDVQSSFQKLQQNYSTEECQHLIVSLSRLEEVKSIRRAHRLPIYQFFLRRELKTLNYIKGAESIDYRIMKLTKCKVPGLELDWRQLWERVVSEVPEVSSSNSKAIDGFFKHIQGFFDPNNALQVWEYFQKRDQKQMHKILSMFVHISASTRQEVFGEYIDTLVRNQKIKKIKNSDFLSLFLRSDKSRKQLQLSQEVTDYINDLVVEYVLASGEGGASKKASVEAKFDGSSAELIEKVIGKANNGSIKLLRIVFSFIKKFIKPLENSTKSVMFLYYIIKLIFTRVQKEKRSREALVKINDKILKRKQSELEELNKEQTTDERPRDKEEEDNDEQDEQQEQEEEDNDEEMLMDENSLNFGKEDEKNDKADTDEDKRQKLKAVLVNQITEQILQFLQSQLQQIFQILYYVNSKKSISHMLRYIYRLYPQFVMRSLDVLDKAASIPNINQDGLIRNLTVSIEHMFTQANYKQGLRNLMRVLEKAYNSRRIVEVWPIYESVSSKIPLLDQKDLESVPEEDKLTFQRVFEMNHDRFYQTYSDHMLEAFKRLIRQGEYLQQKNASKPYALTMMQLYYSSYPHMRKCLLEQVMQVLTDKPNTLALMYFCYAELPQREFQILRTQYLAMNEENTDTESIRQQILSVLTKKMTLDELKPHIRKMAEKGHFKIVEEYNAQKVIEVIDWQSYKTTLNHFYENPNFKMEFMVPAEARRSRLKELMDYRDELIEEAGKQVDQMEEDEKDSVANRIVRSYTSPAKVSTLQRRKKLYEILSIVSAINSLMEQKLIEIKSPRKLELVDSGVAPYQFLNIEKPFSKSIKKLLNCQEVLHDTKLITIINSLLTGEYFLYHDIEAYEEKTLSRERKRNKNHESPGYLNRFIYGLEYVGHARKYMGALLHKTNGATKHSIADMVDQLFVLCMVNSNESYKDIRSMFEESGMVVKFRAYVCNLFKLKVANRELIRRISSTIDFLTKSQISYLPYPAEYVLEFVNYHTILMQAEDSKIKENAIKSFRKFSKIIADSPIDHNLTLEMEKYLSISKMEIVWMIYAISVVVHPNFFDDRAQVEERLKYFLVRTERLLLHDTRSIRRLSIYFYASLVRYLKKIHVQYETKQYEVKHFETKKSLEDFIDNGYLRPHEYDIDFKSKPEHRKHFYTTYQVKKSEQYQMDHFKSLVESPENAIKFIKDFHADFAATVEMLASAMQSSLQRMDLSTIASRSLEKMIFFFKTREIASSKGEMVVGGKLFKYLCIEDSLKGFKFFKAVKQFVLSCISNMESLDNQTLVILYSYSLLSAYDTTFKERVPEIEEFLTVILKEIIKKSSKLIFTKLQTIFFKKIKNRQAVQFIEELCEKMIEENNKVYRSGYLLAALKRSYFTSEQILKKMFEQRLELEHEGNLFNKLYYLLNFPQSSIWHLDELLQSRVIDVEGLKKQGRVTEELSHYLMVSNKELKSYIAGAIRGILEEGSQEMVKTGFTILNSTIRSSADLYMSQENQQFITELLGIWVRILNEKKELQLDFESGYKVIAYLLGARLLRRETFNKFLTAILGSIEPSKKSCDLLLAILGSPCNYINIDWELYHIFTRKILELQSNSSLYKQLLQILSTFFRYRAQQYAKVSQIEKESKSKRALLLQAYLLAENEQLNPEIVKETLRISAKDRKIVWAREMMFVRGQRQFFDREQVYEVWREIKSLSNPYHYHA